MRITQNMSYQIAVASMQATSQSIATTQEQISTGQKFQTAAQDPTDAAQLLNLNTQLASIKASSQTLNTAQLQLQTESQALTDAQGILQQASTLAVQANSGTLSATDRTAIAQQIVSLKQQLLAVANRTTASGEPLFGGGTASGAVFAVDANGQVSYTGGDEPPWLQVDTGTSMPAGDTGRQVFMTSPNGSNGVQLQAGAHNTGSLLLQGVTPGPSGAPSFTLSFGAGGQYTATAPNGSVLATGTYAAGQSLTIDGATLTLSGQPDNGDTVSVQPPVNQSLFATLTALANAVQIADPTQRSNAINGASSAVHAGLDHLVNVSTENGGRLNALTALQNAQQTQATNVQAVAAKVGGTDYAAAVSQLSLLTTTLQAAQQSFAKIQSLSLFQWIH